MTPSQMCAAGITDSAGYVSATSLPGSKLSDRSPLSLASLSVPSCGLGADELCRKDHSTFP